MPHVFSGLAPGMSIECCLAWMTDRVGIAGTLRSVPNSLCSKALS